MVEPSHHPAFLHRVLTPYQPHISVVKYRGVHSYIRLLLKLLRAQLFIQVSDRRHQGQSAVPPFVDVVSHTNSLIFVELITVLYLVHNKALFVVGA